MERGAVRAPKVRAFEKQDLWRLTIWGAAAAGALLLAVYAGNSESGRERVVLALAQTRAQPQAQSQASSRADKAEPAHAFSARDGQALAERVKYLQADRDDLVTRLALLERGAEELRMAVARTEQLALETKKAAEQMVAATPPAPAETTASIPESEPTPATPPVPDKMEFGLDLGPAPNFEGLRNLWANARRRHGAALDGLRPIVHLRERPRPSPHELRLIAGPLPSAAAAARLCVSIVAAGAVCQPAAFDGQRLAVR